MGWWLLRLTVNILAISRLTIDFLPLWLNKTFLRLTFFYAKQLEIFAILWLTVKRIFLVTLTIMNIVAGENDKSTSNYNKK